MCEVVREKKYFTWQNSAYKEYQIYIFSSILK